MNQPLNQRTAAVVDPILSTHARGYRNAEFISEVLFPRVPIPNRAMRVIKFGKEAFRMLNTRRAPGAKKKRVQYGYASDPVSLVQDALEGLVPIEHQQEAASVPGVDLGAGAVNMVLNVIDLGHEYAAAQLARSAANYDANHKVALTTTDRWTSDSSNPVADVDAGKEAVRRSIGRYPNTLVLGPSAFTALKNHPKVKEQFKYTSKDSITAEMLAAYFDVARVVVGKAVWLPENAADDTLASDVWGNDAVLAYVPMTGESYQVPSYGYTYELSGYPQVQQPYFERDCDSWIYPTTSERRVILTGAEGGFLFQDAGAAAA
ncbi:major capsid protein E [Rhodobacter aestuarii]|uniref:Phage major capsid protein E n=1 Tax=Rhodobacter aestuarii TaxID=453582 RepID=A0A1N7Q1G5_9RHOB|nr:major capsid protein [Rhodobacter aestuarii]PTV94025.1 major capsid protein E [Rhodobacter aestuarii]SIT16708.1 Phage major capsid protein E [Rhodobacter aestuarii]